MIFSSIFLNAVTFSHVLHLDVLRRQIELKLKAKIEISLCIAIVQNHPSIPIYTVLPYCVIRPQDHNCIHLFCNGCEYNYVWYMHNLVPERKKCPACMVENNIFEGL